MFLSRGRIRKWKRAAVKFTAAGVEPFGGHLGPRRGVGGVAAADERARDPRQIRETFFWFLLREPPRTWWVDRRRRVVIFRVGLGSLGRPKETCWKGAHQKEACVALCAKCPRALRLF